MLILLTLIGCTDLMSHLDDTGVDTGIDGDLEARIQAWCIDETCTQVGLYGGESAGIITHFTWTVDGTELTSGATETILDMSTAGDLLDAVLTVEDGSGNTSQANMLVMNLGTEASEAEEIQAIVVMPPPVSCSSAIPVVSIGGCVSNLKGLHFEAWDHTDPTSGSTSLRQDGIIDFEFANGGSLQTVGFADAAAWYLTANHPTVSLHNISPSQYVIGAANFPPHVVDPIIGNPAPGSTIYTQHVSFWFIAQSYGTNLRVRHTLPNGKGSSSPFLLQASCTNDSPSFRVLPAN